MGLLLGQNELLPYIGNVVTRQGLKGGFFIPIDPFFAFAYTWRVFFMSAPFSKLRAIGFVTDVFLSVAIPATFFAWAGRTLDKKWNISPWMTVIGFLIAIVASGALVYRKAKQAAEDMKKQ